MAINKYEMEMFRNHVTPVPKYRGQAENECPLGAVMPFVNALVRNGFYDANIPAMVWRDGAHK